VTDSVKGVRFSEEEEALVRMAMTRLGLSFSTLVRRALDGLLGTQLAVKYRALGRRPRRPSAQDGWRSLARPVRLDSHETAVIEAQCLNRGITYSQAVRQGLDLMLGTKMAEAPGMRGAGSGPERWYPSERPDEGRTD
jgi:hypothetical protein